MKNEAKDTIAKIFCKNNNIDAEALPENLEIVVTEVYAPFLLFIECLSSKQFAERNNPFDGFFINMLNRASNTFGGMVTLLTTGHLQDSEVLSRTLTESSLTIQFLLKGDSEEKLAHYLASYYFGQKWKNDKWQSAVSDFEIHPHNRLIQEKNEIEEKSKQVCKYFIEEAGGRWPEKPQSASVDKMFKELGREVEYRTVYRAMCGQSHQNQEDLVNSLLYSLSEDESLEIKSKHLKHAFSVFIVLWGVQYFLGAIESLGNFYGFATVQQQSKLAREIIDKHHAEITESLKKCILPKGWVNVVVDGI
ncbi:DUF5677 domain-containing protein [Methylomonas sp. BW4-1]|uniref:DUF5677 domain-containing protein n=1 Tax=Methylomonas sp. BW4-1 TaxID=3376685 RepID=UPI00404131C3